MQYTITNADWTQISRAGKNITARLDEQDDGASGSVDIRVYCSIEKPALTDEVMTQSKRIYKPVDNDGSLLLSPRGDLYSWWARSAKSGDAATIIADEDGIGFPARADVFVQDQHSAVVEGFFAEELAITTVVSGGAVDTRTITVAAGHGFVGFTTAPGECLVFKGYYMGRVLAVATNTLTVDMPFNISIPAGTTVYRASTNMLVDGSVTPHLFKFVSTAGVKFDIRGLRFVFRSANVMDYTKFGGATEISAPFVVRKKITSTRYNNIVAARNNGELELTLSLKASDRAPSGEYGMLAEYPSSESRGVVLRVDGDKGEELQAVVYANLATGNTYLRGSVYGHVVED